MKWRLFLSLLAAATFGTAGANASSSSFSGRGRALLQAEAPERAVPEGYTQGISLRVLVHIVSKGAARKRRPCGAVTSLGYFWRSHALLALIRTSSRPFSECFCEPQMSANDQPRSHQSESFLWVQCHVMTSFQIATNA